VWREKADRQEGNASELEEVAVTSSGPPPE
jgi:hypothetical protein